MNHLIIAAIPNIIRSQKGDKITTFPSAYKSLVKRLQVENLRHNRPQNGIVAAGVDTILIAALVAIFIAATEALAEVVVVILLVYVKAIIAVVRVLIGIRVFIVVAPTIRPVCLSGAVALIIAVVYGLLEQICTVLIRFVVPAATRVTIIRGSVEVRIIIVIVVLLILETFLLLTQALQILLLKAILRQTLLLL